VVSHAISPLAFEKWIALITEGAPSDAIFAIAGHEARVQEGGEKVADEKALIGDANHVPQSAFAEKVQAVRAHVEQHAERVRGESSDPVAEYLFAQWNCGTVVKVFACVVCYQFERPPMS